MSNDLLFSIGLDVADLKTSARAAKEQADDIKKGFKGFKDVLEAGGVAAAVFSFFNSVIDYAQKANAPIDSNTAAVKRFGDAITEAKQFAIGMGAEFLGFFNKAGEGYGMFARTVVEGSEKFWQSLKKMDFEGMKKSFRESFKEVRESERGEIESINAINQGKERRKQIEEEIKKLTQSIAESEKRMADLDLEGITKQETMNKLFNEYQRISDAIKDGAQDTLTQKRLEAEQGEIHVKIYRTQLDLRKEDAEFAKKTSAAEAKALDERYKQLDALGEVKAKQLAYERAKLSVEEQSQLLTTEKYQLEKLLLDKNISMTKETETRNRLLEITKQLDEFAVEDAEEHLEIEKAITDQKSAQVEITSSGPGYQSQSTAALQGQRARVASNLSDAEFNDVLGANRSPFGTLHDASIEQFRNQLAKIDAELALRRTVQNYSARYGEDAAVRQYGDEVTQRAFKDMAATSVRTQNAVEGINTTLNRIFTK